VKKFIVSQNKRGEQQYDNTFDTQEIVDAVKINKRRSRKRQYRKHER